jgi:peroxiredoxin
LRDHHEEFERLGATLLAIGMGTPEVAAHFRDKQEIPFPLLVDHRKQTYRALEIGRGSWMDVAGPKVWARGAKGVLTGKGVAVARQDPLQLGGAIVVEAGGRVRYMHRAKTSSDNPKPEELLEQLR